MTWSEREEINRRIALDRFNRENETKQNRKAAYESAHRRAVETLSPAVETFAAALHKREGLTVDGETAAILNAYTAAKTALLRLLKEDSR